jgi:hypothetical protein
MTGMPVIITWRQGGVFACLGRGGRNVAQRERNVAGVGLEVYRRPTLALVVSNRADAIRTPP